MKGEGLGNVLSWRMYRQGWGKFLRFLKDVLTEGEETALLEQGGVREPSNERVRKRAAVVGGCAARGEGFPERVRGCALGGGQYFVRVGGCVV